MHTHSYSCIIHSSQRVAANPVCSLTGERVKKVWYICTLEYYSPLKRNQSSDTSYNTRILSEISQSQIRMSAMRFHLVLRRVKFMEMGRRVVAGPGWGAVGVIVY